MRAIPIFPRNFSLPLFIGLIALASCGVVTHGSGAGADGGGGSSSALLGERAVPGYALSVTRLSEIHPGQSCTVRVTVTPDSGQPAPARLEVWLGTTTYDSTATTSAAMPITSAANAYDVTVALPASLPTDAVVWIRLTTVDGAVIEAGREAFPLAVK